MTSIGEGAFHGCSGLTSVTIPQCVCTNELRNIFSAGAYTNIAEVIVMDGVTIIGRVAFHGCSGLTSVTIPDSVTNIGLYAFGDCSGLTSVTIPDSVTSIGEGAFANCVSLKSMTLPFIGSRRGDNTGPNAVFGYIFGGEDFQGATNTVSTYLTGGTKTAKLNRYLPVSLKSVTITDESLVARGAFDMCRCLTNIVINSGVEYIGQYAFCYNSFHEINIPNGVAKVDENAFYCCTEMTSVTVPNSVTNISIGTFSGCSSLTNMVLPFIGRARRNVLPTYTIESLFGYIFGTRSYDGGAATRQNNGAGVVVTNYIPRVLSSVTITDETTETGCNAFLNCSYLKCVILSEGMKRIRGSSFDSCSSLEDVYIPHSVTQLVGNCFYGCKSLKSIKIPASVSVINNKVFRNCSKLDSVVFEGDAPIVGTEVFYGTDPNCTAYVKLGSTGWGVEIPGIWNGIQIEYLDRIPEVDVNANASVVTNAIEAAKFADEMAIKAAIGGSAEEYTAFKTWAGSVKGTTGNAQAGEAAVVASPHAAAAYLLGAERLFANAPTGEIGEVSVGDGESAGTTAMSIAVTVKDGESAVAVNVAKIKAMFEATGDLGDWNGAAKLTPEVMVEEGDGATMRFKVTPGDGTAPRAFLRIRK